MESENLRHCTRKKGKKSRKQGVDKGKGKGKGIGHAFKGMGKGKVRQFSLMPRRRQYLSR
jgi:hypothetical protein